MKKWKFKQIFWSLLIGFLLGMLYARYGLPGKVRDNKLLGARKNILNEVKPGLDQWIMETLDQVKAMIKK